MKNNYKCLICNKELERVNEHLILDYLGPWKNGVVDRFYVSYGSKHSGNAYIFALCDECIDKALVNNKIKPDSTTYEKYEEHGDGTTRERSQTRRAPRKRVHKGGTNGARNRGSNT